MFGNSNNNSEAKSVNTRGITLFSDKSFMSLNFWNTNISITLGPASGTTTEGKTLYDENKRYQTSMVIDKVYMLLEEIKEDILPAIKKYQETGVFEGAISRGFDVGKNKDSGIFIEWKILEGEEVPHVFLAYYKDINSDNIAGDGCLYRFNKNNTIRNYEPSTGAGEPAKRESEFRVFCKILESHVLSLGITVHAEKFKKENDYRKGGAPRGMNGGGGESGYQAAESFSDDDLPF